MEGSDKENQVLRLQIAVVTSKARAKLASKGTVPHAENLLVPL